MLDHWLAVLLVAMIVAGLGLVAPRAIRRIADDHRLRHQAYVRSEAFAFDRLCNAVRHRDARSTYFALLEWLPHLDATQPANTGRAFKTLAHDPELDRQIGALESELFASRRGQESWSPRKMLNHIAAARRNLRPRASRGDRTALPQHLNPVGTSNTPAYGSRRPAR
jgi:hypothetical protein